MPVLQREKAEVSFRFRLSSTDSALDSEHSEDDSNGEENGDLFVTSESAHAPTRRPHRPPFRELTWNRFRPTESPARVTNTTMIMISCKKIPVER